RRFMYVSGWEGSFWAQTPADEIIRSIAEVARLAGARCAYTDQREYFALSAIARLHRLRLEERPFTGGPGGSKERAVAIFRRWLAAGDVLLPPHEKLKSELLAFVERPTPSGGLTFGARGSGHDDYAVLPLI